MKSHASTFSGVAGFLAGLASLSWLMNHPENEVAAVHGSPSIESGSKPLSFITVQAFSIFSCCSDRTERNLSNFCKTPI